MLSLTARHFNFGCNQIISDHSYTHFCLFPPLKNISAAEVATVQLVVRLQSFMFSNTKVIAVVVNTTDFITWDYTP